MCLVLSAAFRHGVCDVFIQRHPVTAASTAAAAAIRKAQAEGKLYNMKRICTVICVSLVLWTSFCTSQQQQGGSGAALGTTDTHRK